MAATHRDVKANGVRLRVALSGDGSPVVMLHGLFMDHRTWDGVSGALAPMFRVVAPDFPGFGDSEKPSPSRFSYDVSAFAEVVADLYAGLDLGRAAVVGHDLGGAVAITLAARHPELVSR
ncbi:MAG TPA: alpha/beta fold hydrolase, partial [Polyangiaceae bacterium]